MQRLSARKGKKMDTVVQINSKFMKQNTQYRVGKTVISVTPPIDSDYWLFRVPVGRRQAIVGFPKFGTIGIGFQHEEDWNTNLPYDCDAQKILDHIHHNKGDDSISDTDCIEAIKAIQKQAKLWNASK